MQIKSVLRKELIEKRRNISDKASKDLAIFERMIALPEFINAKLVLMYVSTSIEVDTRRLIDYCFENDINVAVPVIVDEVMRFFLIESLDDIGDEVLVLTNGICVVPGLAFDSRNRRLGYGGGYYDRFLREFSGYKIGLCYDEFIIDIPIEEHDVGVDLVIWN